MIKKTPPPIPLKSWKKKKISNNKPSSIEISPPSSNDYPNLESLSPRSRYLLECAREQRLNPPTTMEIKSASKSTVKLGQITSILKEGSSSAISAVSCALGKENDYLIASASQDGLLCITTFSSIDGSQQSRLEKETKEMILSCEFYPKQHPVIIACGSSSGRIHIYSMEEGGLEEEVMVLSNEFGDDIWSLCFSIDGEFIFSGASDNWITIHHVASGRREKVLKDIHKGWIYSLSNSSSLLACGSRDCTISLLKIENILNSSEITNVDRLKGHTDGVTGVSFSSSSESLLLASSSIDKTVKLWDCSSLTCLRTFKGHEGNVRCITFCENLIFSGSFDNSVLVWDSLINETEPVLKLLGHTQGITTIKSLHKDHELIVVTGSSDYSVRIWQVLSFE